MEIYILLLFMIIAAIVAVEINDLLSSIIAVGAVGLGVSIAFLMLKAPDLAITQLVVEILCVIILIRATLKRDLSTVIKGKSILSLAAVLLFIALFLIFAARGLRDLPEFGKPLMRVSKTYIDEGSEKTGAVNIVAAIILDYRAYDTLGEATILFTAVLGVLAIMRHKGRKKEHGKPEEKDE